MNARDDSTDRPVCAVAGASSAIGRLLAERLQPSYRPVALTTRASPEGVAGYDERRVRRFNPFSLEETVAVCDGVDRLVYLPHHFRPAGQWIQGAPDALDLLRAANLAAAAERHDIERIVTLASGLELAAADPAAELRAEAGRIEESDVPVTTVAADAVVGPGTPLNGLVRGIAERPGPIRAPAWSRRRRAVVAADDAARVVAERVGDDSERVRREALVPRERTSLRDLVGRALDESGRSVEIRNLAGNWPRLSVWRLSRLSNSDNLRMRAVVELFRAGAVEALEEARRRSVPTAATAALAEGLRTDDLPVTVPTAGRELQSSLNRPDGVYSLQLLPNPAGLTAGEVAAEYFDWAQGAVRWFLRIERSGDRVEFFARGTRIPLLILRRTASGVGARVAYRVIGGRLARGDGDAYFEFRSMPGNGEILVALRNYRTVLPWLLYRSTQGFFHGLVMRQFGRHLAGLSAPS